MTMIPAIDIGNDVKFHGACIRISDTKNQQPYIHHNSAHACAGITGIEPQTDGRLRVYFERDPDGRTRPIISGFVDGDEAFAQNWGWRVGFTGGVGHADLVFAYQGTERSCWHPQLHRPSQNLWVGFTTIGRDTMADMDLDCDK